MSKTFPRKTNPVNLSKSQTNFSPIKYYQSYEIRSAMVAFMAMVVLSSLLIINDFWVIHNPNLLLTVLTLRLMFLTTGLFFSIYTYLFPRNPRYFLQMSLAIGSAVLLFFLANTSRPLPINMGIAVLMIALGYVYLLLPARVPQKVIYALAFTGAEAWRYIPDSSLLIPSKITVFSSLAIMNVIGLLGAISHEKQRIMAFDYRTSQKEKDQLNQLLITNLYDGVLTLKKALIHDFNKSAENYCKMIGLSLSQYRNKPLTQLIKLESEKAEQGVILGPSEDLPLDIKIITDTESEVALLIFREHFEAVPGDAPELERRVDSLKLSGFNLSAREREITLGLLQGKSRLTLADELYISDETVKSHCRNIYRKLEVRSRLELYKKLQP